MMQAVQDYGRSMYCFGARTHADFQGRGNTKLSISESIKKLVIDRFEPDVRTVRAWTSPESIGATKFLTYNRFKEVYCYQASHYRHHQLSKAKENLEHYINIIEAKCDVVSIKDAPASNLISSTSKVSPSDCDLEIIDSPLLPAGVFTHSDCVYSTTRNNLKILQTLGYRIFVSGDTKGQWKPQALAYGKAVNYSILPTWCCTVTGDESDYALVLLLKQALLAVASATKCYGKAENGAMQFICHFNSSSFHERAKAVLCDAIGFEPSNDTPFYGNYSRYAIYELPVN